MTNHTPHGQVPESLIDLIDAYAETRHRCGGIYNAKTEAARKAVIEALSGVQALSAAPEAIAKLRHLYQNMVNGAVRDTASAKRIAEGLLAPAIEALERATPPAEQQAAPKAAPGVGNSGFDHQTAADFLSGKTVSDEAVRKFVAASRWAHDERAALSATLLAMHGALTSREAEIALLKKALLEAETAPQQEAQEPCGWTTGITWRPDTRLQSEQVIKITRDAQPKYGYTTPIYTAPQQEAQEPGAYVHVPHSTVEGKVRPVVSFEKYQQDYADGIYSTRIPLYTAPQPAPAPLSEMPYEKRKAIQEGEQIGASDAWFHARHNMLDTLDRRNVFRAGFDRGWNAAIAAQGGKA